MAIGKINAQPDLNQNFITTLANPDVYNLEKYNLNQIDQYTGRANINVPIYTIKTGSLEYPINLVYNSSGIKVDQLASNVGLGWNLTSTIVTRTINQDNDFDNTGSLMSQPDYYTYSSDDKTKDFMANPVKFGYFLQKQLNINATTDGRVLTDNLPDVYHFYTNKLSTSFFFNDINSPVEMNPKGTKIQATASKIRIVTNRSYFNRYSNAWTPFDFLTNDFFNIIITTNQGVKYTFSDCDYTLGSTYSNPYTSPAQISAWHITKIEDLKTGKKIDFIYDVTSSNPISSAGTLNGPLELYYSFGNTNSYDTYQYKLVTTNRIDIQKKRLKKIIFDEGEVDFNYNNIGVGTTIVRNDVYNSDCVTQIYIKDKNLASIKSFELKYDYFTSDSNGTEFNPDNGVISTYRYKRLKLLSIGEIGKPKYKFTYNESINLPPINSFSVDFLGYYNKSPDISNLGGFYNNSPTPTIYFYPTNFEKSVLPYPVSSLAGNIVPGYFNRQANEYAKAWSLIKMDLVTGGSVDYIYESNKFLESGQTIIGGGIRIAQLKLNDGFGGTKTINYTYLKTDGTSSGTLSSTPYFGTPKFSNTQDYSMLYSEDEQSPPVYSGRDQISVNSYIPLQSNYFYLCDKSNVNADITTGSYVGYSRVIETEIGTGRKEYTFSSNDLTGFKNYIYRTSPTYIYFNFSNLYFTNDMMGDCNIYTDESGVVQFPDVNFAIHNSGIYTNIFTDNGYKRGNLLTESIFNETNNLIKSTTINYTENLITTYNYHQAFFEGSALDDHDPSSNCRQPNCAKAFIIARKDIKVAQFLPTTKIVSKFDDFGNQNDIVSNYNYNQNGILNSEQFTVSSTNGDSTKKQYYYPQDSQMSGEPFVSDLIAANITGIPIKTETYRNAEKLSEEKTIYSNDGSTNNILLPKYVYAKKGNDTNSTIERKITFDKYDTNSTLLQYTLENGTPVSIIWGYNKTQPIAKIVNKNYLSIPVNLITAAQTASNTTNGEASLLLALNAIRTNAALTNSMITTYTYIPLVGISTITDPKGNKTTYTYDSFGRLQNLKDKDNNILSEKDYNYVPQN